MNTETHQTYRARLDAANHKLEREMEKLNGALASFRSMHPDGRLVDWKIPVGFWGWLFGDATTLTRCKVTEIDRERRIVKADFYCIDGGITPPHKHYSAEDIVFHTGRAMVTVSGKSRLVTGPDTVRVPSLAVHSAHIIEPCWCTCIYYLSEKDSEEVFYVKP